MNNDIKQSNDERLLWDRVKECFKEEKKATCLDINDLAAYIDGKAGKTLIESIELHLTECPTCLNSLEEIRALLKEEPKEVPKDVKIKAKSLVLGSVSKQPQLSIKEWLSTLNPFPSLNYRWSFAASIAIVLLVCSVGVHLGHDLSINQRKIISSLVSEISIDFGRLSSF